MVSGEGSTGTNLNGHMVSDMSRSAKYLASFSAKKRAVRLIESGGRRVRTKAFWFEKFPFLGFLAGGYDLDKLTGDCIAGLTTALTVIPQGIGYAPLAGLPLQVRGSREAHLFGNGEIGEKRAFY